MAIAAAVVVEGGREVVVDDVLLVAVRSSVVVGGAVVVCACDVVANGRAVEVGFMEAGAPVVCDATTEVDGAIASSPELVPMATPTTITAIAMIQTFWAVDRRRHQPGVPPESPSEGFGGPIR
jgi:hypothetical protein